MQKKQRQVVPSDDQTRVGDQWTFVALDADTKLVPSYRIGKARPSPRLRRSWATLPLAWRTGSSSLLTLLRSMSKQLKRLFGADVDYGQVVKIYEAEPAGAGRYSPPQVVRAERKVIQGSPDRKHISTSLIERQKPHLIADEHAPVHASDERFSARRWRTCKRPWGSTLRTTTSCAFTRSTGSRQLWRPGYRIGYGRCTI